MKTIIIFIIGMIIGATIGIAFHCMLIFVKKAPVRNQWIGAAVPDHAGIFLAPETRRYNTYDRICSILQAGGHAR